MHDFHLSAIYADLMTILCDGQILALGSAGEVITVEIPSEACSCDLRVNTIPGA